MLQSLIRVCLRGDQSAPVNGQPLRSGISGAAALAALEKANGPGSLQDPAGVFVSTDDKNLAPGIYSFIPVEPGMSARRSSSTPQSNSITGCLFTRQFLKQVAPVLCGNATENHII